MFQTEFPNYEPILKEFESMIKWKSTSNGKKVPEPVLGLDEDFDLANSTVDKNKEAINQYEEDL